MMGGRIGRFVGAAHRLMWMQLALALLAVGLAAWAVIAVRDLAEERDRLQERVAQLEAQAPAPLAPELTGPTGDAGVPTELPPPPAALTVNQAEAAPSPGEPQPLAPPPPAATPAPTTLPPATTPPPRTSDAPPVRPAPRQRPTERWSDPGLLIERPNLPRPNIERPTIPRPTINTQGTSDRQSPNR